MKYIDGVGWCTEKSVDSWEIVLSDEELQSDNFQSFDSAEDGESALQGEGAED